MDISLVNDVTTRRRTEYFIVNRNDELNTPILYRYLPANPQHQTMVMIAPHIL